MRLVIRAALAAGCTAIAACGGGSGTMDTRQCNDGGSGNTLTGSYCEDTPMMFTSTRFLVIPMVQSLRIEYDRPIGTGSEKTLQIILIGDIKPNADIFILPSGSQVRRLLADASQPQDLTGELDPKSKVVLSDYSGTIGSHIGGMFAFLFKSGRTLGGNFDGKIENAMP